MGDPNALVKQHVEGALVRQDSEFSHTGLYPSRSRVSLDRRAVAMRNTHAQRSMDLLSAGSEPFM